MGGAGEGWLEVGRREGLEGWKVGGLEAESWKAGGLEGEGWKAGGLEGWKLGLEARLEARLEGWRA